MTVPWSIEQLTPQWFSAVLGRQIDTVECRTFAEGVGMLSVMVRAELTTPVRRESVVVKLPPWRLKNQGMGTQWGYFLREARFYQELAARVPNVPRCHYAEIDHEARVCVLVMDDHTDSRPIDQLVGATIADAETVIDAAAGMHATWWEHPELTSCGFIPPLDDDVAGRSARMVREGFPVFAVKHRHLVPDTAFLAAEGYIAQIERFYRMWAAEGPHTLMHNDLRLDNMLMTGRGVLFVDWQRLIRFHGACDIAYFLAGSLTVADRREHEDALLRRYYERLLQAGVEGFAWETCRRHYREAMVRWLGLVTVASLLDVANTRGEALIATMVERHFTAAADHDALALVS